MPALAAGSSSLWRHPDFMKFWAGDAVSRFGTQFTLLALPLTAVLTLHVSPVQMGVLGALQTVPSLLFALPAGVWLDRTSRRPAMVAAALLNGAAIGTVPVAALLHQLSLWQLYAVAFVSGSAGAVYLVAERSYFPTLVGRVRLLDANAKVQTTMTVASLAGPGLAGVVVQLLTAPLAMAVDALSFLVTAATTAWIRAPEPRRPAEPGRRLVAEVREGLVALWSEPLTRAVTLTLVVANIATGLTFAVFALLFVGQLHLAPSALGLLFGLGSLSSLAGAQLSGLLVKRLGLGVVLSVATTLFGLGFCFYIVAAQVPVLLMFALLLTGQVIGGFGVMTFNVNQQAIRQAITPDRVLSRVNAGMLMLVFGGQTLGALAGGGLGQAFGLRTALTVGCIGALTTALPVLASPLRSLRALPEPIPA